MNFLYHIINEDVAGGALYPLNQLKEIYPALYASCASKYDGRKHVMELYIPQLQCNWSDVIHLSAVHPDTVIKTLREAGAKKDYSFKYYEIDPMLLDLKKTIVHPNTPRENPRETTKDDFVKFDPHNLGPWSVFPQETLTYYKSKFAKNELPLLFLFVPHILYQGSIDVSRLEKKSIG